MDWGRGESQKFHQVCWEDYGFEKENSTWTAHWKPLSKRVCGKFLDSLNNPFSMNFWNWTTRFPFLNRSPHWGKIPGGKFKIEDARDKKNGRESPDKSGLDGIKSVNLILFEHYQGQRRKVCLKLKIKNTLIFLRLKVQEIKIHKYLSY